SSAANPKPTGAYRQEFLTGHAEDQAWIVARHEQARVPYGRVKDVVRSYEWTRLEPNVVSLKLYAPHLGIVMEKDVAGGSEFMQLVAVHHHCATAILGGDGLAVCRRDRREQRDRVGALHRGGARSRARRGRVRPR